MAAHATDKFNKKGKLEGCKSKLLSDSDWYHCYEVGEVKIQFPGERIVKVVIHCGRCAGDEVNVEADRLKRTEEGVYVRRVEARCWVDSDTGSDVEKEPSPDLVETFEIDGQSVQCVASKHGSRRMIGGVKKFDLAAVKVGPLKTWVRDDFGAYENGNLTLRFGRANERGRVVLASNNFEQLDKVSKSMNKWLSKKLRTDEYWACPKCVCKSCKFDSFPCPCVARIDSKFWQIVCNPAMDESMKACGCCYYKVRDARTKMLTELKGTGKFARFLKE